MKIKPIKVTLLGWAVFLLVLNTGYAMQPPPLPLTLAKFQDLVSQATVIAVGKVGEVRETDKTVNGRVHRTITADLSIEKLLKGTVPDKNLTIQESYVVLTPSLPGGASREGKVPTGVIVGRQAGPSTYHGHYARGMRLIVLLERASGTQGYKPLGSGSYNKYLCEFLLEDGGIKPQYFRFAEDMSPYTDSEDNFVNLINRLRHSDS